MDNDLVMATVRLHTHMHCYIHNARGEKKKKKALNKLSYYPILPTYNTG